MALPLLPPLQLTLAVMLADAEKAIGWVIVTDAVVEQLFASFTVTVYVPALNEVAVTVVCELASDHK